MLLTLSCQLLDLKKDKDSLLAEVNSLESKLAHALSSDKSRLQRQAELESKIKQTQDMLNIKEDDSKLLHSFDKIIAPGPNWFV